MKKILSILITFIVLSAQAQDTLVTIKGVKRAASTVGLNYINLTNPSAITFPRMNADNSITSRTAAELLSDIGAWGISGNTGTGGTGKLGTTDNQPFAFYTNNTSRGSISAAGVFSITKDASISTVFVGQGNNSVTGNVKVGTSNTLSLISTGNVNTVVGYDAGTKLTTGSQNVFMGYQAGEKDTIGNANVAIGVQAGQNNNATRNTFIGPAAGVNCLSCTGVIMLENGAIMGNGISTGYDNIIIGNGFTGMSPSLHHTIDIGHKFISDSSEKIYLNHNGNQASLTGTDSLMAQTSDNKVIKVPVSAVSGGGGLTVNNPAYTGVLTTGTLGYTATNPLATFQSSVNAFNQFIIQNSNNGASASSDVVVNNDVSTNTTFYGDFGMNSSGFTGSGALNQPSYVYLTSTSSDLAIGTTTSNPIHFVVNSGATDALTIGTTGLITGGTAASATAAVSTLALRDANGNITNVNSIEGYSTTVTAAGTTTLTVSSNYQQFFSGSTTQTVVLPVTSTLVLGQTFIIVNNSTGLVTVNSSGANNVIILAGGTSATLTCILTSGTTAASWNVLYEGQSIATGKKLTVSNSITFAGTDATVMTLPTTTQTLAGLSSTQTFTGAVTFNNAAVLAGAATMAIFNTTATNVSAFGAATTGSIFGTATATRTISIAGGATAGGATLNLNIGTGGAVSSTTNVSFGSNISATTVDMKGVLQITHLAGNSNIPSIAAGVGSGTTPTLSVATGSTDLSGYLNITTGTTPTASGTVATITFSSAYASAPKCVQLQGCNAAAAALTGATQVFVLPANTTTTTFVITAGSGGLAASTAYQFSYHVIN